MSIDVDFKHVKSPKNAKTLENALENLEKSWKSAE